MRTHQFHIFPDRCLAVSHGPIDSTRGHQIGIPNLVTFQSLHVDTLFLAERPAQILHARRKGRLDVVCHGHLARARFPG